MTEHASHFAARRAAQWKAGAETSVRRLEDMLDTATSLEAEAIRARIDQIRTHRRAYNSKNRAHLNRRRAAKLRARTPEQLARDQAEAYPDGVCECRRCGKTLPLWAFATDRTKRKGIRPICHSCWGDGDREGEDD